MDDQKSSPAGLRISNDPMYRLLREGCIKEFNVKRAGGEEVDLTRCDLRGLDLRGLNADGLDFSESYFRQTDLRGVDLRGARLEGAVEEKTKWRTPLSTIARSIDSAPVTLTS